AADGGDVLGDRTGGNPADRRHVVGAVDGDGDGLAGGAVAGDGGERVGDRLAGAELLDRGLAVVGGVGRAAVAGGREGAVAAGRSGLRSEVALAAIDVGHALHDALPIFAADGGDVLGDRTGGNPADRRHVVGAVDGDGDGLAGGAVAGDGGERVGDRLAG